MPRLPACHFSRNLTLAKASSWFVVMAVVLLVGPTASWSAQVFTPDPLVEIDENWQPTPANHLRPIVLVGPRGGVCSAQAVVSADAPLKDLKAQLGPWTSTDGRAIAAAAVRVRYATRATPRQVEPATYFDALLDEPSGQTRLQPIWITVDLPENASPGEYRATLTVSADGATHEMPVQLHVARWQIPPPGQWNTWVSLLQSPESVAWKYGVPLWSDEHFQRLRPSLELLGRVGNKVVYVPVICRTHFGNDHGLIVFRRQGDDYVPDFAILDKYLDLYETCVGRPKVLCLYVWEVRMNDRRRGRAKELSLTELTPDGELVEISQPMFGADGTETLWRRVVDGAGRRVEQRGWDPACVMLGVAADRRPSSRTIEFFQQIAPEVRWTIFTHARGDPRPSGGRLNLDGMEVGYEETPGHAAPRGTWNGTLRLGWDAAFAHAGSARGYLAEYGSLTHFRCLAAGLVGFDKVGFGRFGLDYWVVDAPGESAPRRIIGRHQRWHNLFRFNPKSLLAPGPQGAVATVRYEMLREGIQECEARIFIERALTDRSLREKLDEDLAAKCEKLLADRAAVLFRVTEGRVWSVADPWQPETAKLFNLAGEVAAAIGAK